MSAAFIAARVAQAIQLHGKPMTLKRANETDLPLKGKRLDGGVDAIGGTAVQQTFRVRIAPTELLASSWTVKEPKRKDAIVIDGRTRVVEDVSPLGDGEVIAAYELQVSG